MRRRYVTRGDEMCKRCRALCNGYPQVWYKPRARIRACKPEKVPTFSHPLPVSFFQTTPKNVNPQKSTGDKADPAVNYQF